MGTSAMWVKKAKDIHDSGLSLEEYFGIQGGDYATSNKPAESKPATTGAINLPATGTYSFTGRASIKAEAKVSSPELAYYDKGMSVNYDKVLTADGRPMDFIRSSKWCSSLC